MTTQLVRTIAQARSRVLDARHAGFTTGLVPTMGDLHAGHGALIERARRQTDFVVVSVFVNPIQFDRASDYEKYARDVQRDVEFCTAHGVDLVFAPDPAEMYPTPSQTLVEVSGVSEHLCGEFRPGHFRGVATVLAKLFHILPADRAYFGEKDGQQLAVVRRMVADLNFPVTIVAVPTVRDADGLALSSRNQRLTPEQRAIAPRLYQALSAVSGKIAEGCKDAAEAKEAGLAILRQEPLIRVEYFEIVGAADMQPCNPVEGRVAIAAAIWLGETRLIDNILTAAQPS
jgi:pantoate--beta-alanine ligase